MNICRLSSICDTALRLLFTVLISLAFIFSALPGQAVNTKGVLSVSENTSAGKKNDNNLIVGAEEEIEVEETCNDQNRKQSIGGDYLLPVTVVCCSTKDLPAILYFNSCTGVRHFKKPPFYVLYRQLKVYAH